MNLKIIHILLFVLIPLSLFSQDFSLSGKIQDAENIPISYANIIILNKQDSTIVSGTSSNDLGDFFLNNIQANTYILKVSFVGFNTYSKEIQVAKNKNLSTITLTESNEHLDEVAIVVKKPTVKKEVDRLIFNVANTALSEGNMMEVLQSTPGVLVIDNNIQIKSTTPTVYINDKKVHLSGEELAQLLEGSPANSIKSIEVITNPPAKYDASSGAVLNIVMDKNLITGYRGSVFANYTQGVFPRTNVGTTNFYKTEKINVFANYSYTQNKLNRESNEKINFLENDNISEEWNTNIDRNTWTKTHNFNFNLDYFFDNANTLSFSTNLLFIPYYKYKILSNTEVNANGENNSYRFDSNNLSRDTKHNLGFDLDYVHLFKNASKLSFNTHYTVYNYNRKQDVLSRYFFQENLNNFTNAFNTNANQDTDIYTSQLDYSSTINESSSFSVGIKSSFIKTESDIKQFDVVGGNETVNTDNSDAFNYNEAILAAYFSYEKNWEKWSLYSGFRIEQTNIEGQSPITNEENKQDYFKGFPTLNLAYQITEKVNTYVNYKRSVERPNYQDLNSFKYYLNDNTIVTGNPNLQPAFADFITLGTTLDDKYIFEAYYKYTDANFLELPIQNNEENIIVHTPINLSNTVEYGFDFTTFFNVNKNWFVYFVTSFYNVEEQAIFNEELIKTDTWSNYSVLSNDFSFLKDKSLSANLTFIYVGKNQQGFQIVDARLATDLAIKKTILNKKATLSLSASDLFNTQDFTVTSKYQSQNNSRFYNQDNRYIKLGFSYKFGNTTLETNARTKSRKERDRLEKE
ncbi:outer membrane beta-barrel family protein [Oceanihabitans sp. 2_MG-2023]|uniref:TonB-dependent receptor domain-containing protein n=1 Tax=Oceanihabitans sp. 2_MG-2023 TaxID=3062661 RepID=UPI0026E1540A|nr:outer membrane beta-barrel family protein [Oceanihabitans sp. 2_MG-2023]MDO6595817.1 outer membrane beta-barrel family protein [Oceanihabitans sp. 2_MG-2023]